mmetsp:Transcript_12303/g.30079  ORF Transcript_12303/g.30079 Transcript_12303/m.30079 type:complete len:110 (+) Transcript_12303:179-508(+)
MTSHLTAAGAHAGSAAAAPACHKPATSYTCHQRDSCLANQCTTPDVLDTPVDTHAFTMMLAPATSVTQQLSSACSTTLATATVRHIPVMTSTACQPSHTAQPTPTSPVA